MTPQAPVTPVKVERFTSFEALAKNSIDFSAIKFGCLNNGIFEKTEVDTDKSNSPDSACKLKRFHSSMF